MLSRKHKQRQQNQGNQNRKDKGNSHTGDQIPFSTQGCHKHISRDLIIPLLQNDHGRCKAEQHRCKHRQKKIISRICPLLKKYGILTLVDSVSAMFGEEVRVDDYMIDILCGGSQKCVSAPPGLTFVVISDDARNSLLPAFTKNILFFLSIEETVA